MQSIVKEMIRKHNDGFADASVDTQIELCHEIGKYQEWGLTRQNELRDFLVHEHLITDDELFWTMFGHFYVACPQTFLFQEQITQEILETHFVILCNSIGCTNRGGSQQSWRTSTN